MPYAERKFACAGCGGPVKRRAAAGSEVRCIECAVQRSAINALQQHNKSGLFYQRWVDGMRRATFLAEQLADLGAQVDKIG